MKHKMPKRPTREQKKRLTDAGIDWRQYLVQDADNISMMIVHKETKSRKVILC